MSDKEKTDKQDLLLQNMAHRLIDNAITTRSELLKKLIDKKRDIDQEAGYPSTLDLSDYQIIYDREGIGTRVVDFFPEESWQDDPEIFETEDPKDETKFENDWEEFEKARNAYHFLWRIDMLSGIGRFGILLIGFDDGADLSKPVDGIDGQGKRKEGSKKEHKVLFLKPYQETFVKVKTREKDIKNPRYGMPTAYTLNQETVTTDAVIAGTTKQTETIVHWHRVLHVADNRKNSDIYGIPRMQTVFNRLYDLRKILGGAGEMFWLGGFPGISFETQAGAEGATIDSDAMQEVIDKYMNTMQRYIATSGLTAKSLAPNIVGPAEHYDTNIKAIALSIGVPYRVFAGTEEGKLAGGQDLKGLQQRIKKRNNRYVTPLIIRSFIDRLIAAGTLTEPAEENGYTVKWPDREVTSDLERAEVAAKITDAIAKYVTTGADALMVPMDYLTKIIGLSDSEAKAIVKATGAMIKEEVDEIIDVEVEIEE